MSRTLRLTLATLVVAAITAGAAAAGGGGAQKFDLLGPNGNAACDGSGVFSGSPGGFGFAVINAPGDNTVSATVHIDKQQPNTTYNVRLVQGISDCFSVDAQVTTNGQGNGTVHVSEPSTSSTALVAVDPAGPGGILCFVCGPYFVTDTYQQS
jgi:hypothetical protein